MPIAAVLFDLDGTLLDTLADLAHSANRVLESHGFDPHPESAYRYYVGEGVSVLFSRALPEPQRTDLWISRCVEDFRAVYSRHWNVSTKPYLGIPQLLDVLSSRRLRLAILSNKPHASTEQCAQELLPHDRFEVVLGQRDEIPRKPDPAGAWEIARRMGVPPSQFVYLGDSGIDMQTAVRAGMYPVGALWGFRTRDELTANGAKVVIDQPMDFVRVLDALRQPAAVNAVHGGLQ